MLLALGAIITGLALLVWSADKFVDGAVGLAENWGMSKAMIGLTIVSLGTSAPEIFVSVMAATGGNSALAFGNAIGSNIANVALVLGATTLIAVLPIKRGLLKQDLPALLIVTLITGLLLWDLTLSRLDGIILIAMLFALLILLFRYKKEHPEEASNEEEIDDFELKESVVSFVLGLVVLVVSSKLLVWGAVDIATSMGISQIIIGLTIVAIGTSLPELAASITSARRGHHDIALGNIIGSNVLNILTVLSLAAIVQPIAISQEVLFRDYGLMTALTLLLAFFIILPQKKRTLGKPQGILFLLCYAAYMTMLYVEATN
ncbi:calcium/sodium antiporter [Gammaproteobacteria bacterium 45_16_T64]|nr:calcium/sodium antiporter [Gammaproteobacteria bacterium 45_16_T64]